MMLILYDKVFNIMIIFPNKVEKYLNLANNDVTILVTSCNEIIHISILRVLRLFLPFTMESHKKSVYYLCKLFKRI